MLPESMPINSLRDGDDTLERLTPQQLAEIREWNDRRNTFCHGRVDRLLDHITALEAESAALVKYTVHKSQCGTDFSHYAPCSCGLSQLKYGAELLKEHTA